MITLSRNFIWPALWCSILLITFVLLATKIAVSNEDQAIVSATDLSQDASRARSDKLVLVLEFTLEDCPYCELLEEEFLKPMSINQGYREKVIIRSVPIDGDYLIKDFMGGSTTGSQLASRYHVDTTPTMVFLDADGNELSKKLIGIWSIDFFGSFIDERIDLALEKIL